MLNSLCISLLMLPQQTVKGTKVAYNYRNLVLLLEALSPKLVNRVDFSQSKEARMCSLLFSSFWCFAGSLGDAWLVQYGSNPLTAGSLGPCLFSQAALCLSTFTLLLFFFFLPVLVLGIELTRPHTCQGGALHRSNIPKPLLLPFS